MFCSVEIQWDLHIVIHRKPSLPKGKPDEDVDVDLHNSLEVEIRLYSSCSDDLENLLAVLEDGRKGSGSFWVSEIVGSKKNFKGNVTSILVYWCEHYRSLHLWTAKYHTCLMHNGSTGRNDVPWTDRSTTKSVIILFLNLIRSNRLSVQVHEHLWNTWQKRKRQTLLDSHVSAEFTAP